MLEHRASVGVTRITKIRGIRIELAEVHDALSNRREYPWHVRCVNSVAKLLGLRPETL